MQWRKQGRWWTLEISQRAQATLYIAKDEGGPGLQWYLNFPFHLKAGENPGQSGCKIGDPTTMGPDEAKSAAMVALRERAKEFYADIEPLLR